MHYLIAAMSYFRQHLNIDRSHMQPRVEFTPPPSIFTHPRPSGTPMPYYCAPLPSRLPSVSAGTQYGPLPEEAGPSRAITPLEVSIFVVMHSLDTNDSSMYHRNGWIGPRMHNCPPAILCGGHSAYRRA